MTPPGADPLKPCTIDHVTESHGYLFSSLFGAISVGLVILGVELVGPEQRIPARDLSVNTLALAFIGVLACLAVSYFIAMVLSDMIYRARLKWIRSRGSHGPRI